MNKLIYLFVLILGLLLCPSVDLLAGNSLEIGLLVVNDEQIKAHQDLIKKFETTTGVIVKQKFYCDKGYKYVLDKWLSSDIGPDVLYWQAGERLFRLVREGLVEPVDELWDQQKLDRVFPKTIKDLILFEGKPYGIPFSYYQWGFYYRKSLFKQYKLSPPETWEQLLEICKVLKDNNITPFAIGTWDEWTAAGWFEYLNLRLNGLTFHQRLLSGNVSYNDKRVKNVLLYWKELIDKGYFVKDAKKISWDMAVPYLYRNMSGMYLIGNFIEGKIPPEFADDFAFFRFPLLNANIPFYELAPTDIFFIPKYSRKKILANKFLSFIAHADTQTELSEKLGLIPANSDASVSKNSLIQEGNKILKTAEGFSQFYDRDSPIEISKQGITILADFLETADIDKTIQRFEKVRKHFLAVRNKRHK